MTKLLVLALAVALAFPATASAYSECGNPRGPAKNVTTIEVSCSDGRAFARKFAKRDITRSRSVTLPGWKTYYAKVRRVYGGLDVRATRGSKVIRFQVLRGGGGGGRNCDPNYEGACLDPNSPDYDCAGGNGNGPDYTGRVYVVGDDHFDLDANDDGVACE